MKLRRADLSVVSCRPGNVVFAGISTNERLANDRGIFGAPADEVCNNGLD